MPHEELELYLYRHIRKRRIIYGIICVLLLVLSIIFSVLRETTKVVHELEFGNYVIHSYTTYNNTLTCFTAVGWILWVNFVIFFIMDLIFIKYKTVEVNGDYITLYRGYRTRLYINGDMRDELYFNDFTLEGTLSDGSKVHVALSKYRACFTFTNGHHSFEI